MTSLRVGHSEWKLIDGTVTKQCAYLGLLGDDRRHSLTIAIHTRRSHQTGLLEPDFNMALTPDPLPDLDGDRCFGRLTVPGTPHDPAPVPVTVRHEQAALIIAAASTHDAEDLVQTVSNGEAMEFVLLKDGEAVIRLPIPNDFAVYKVLQAAFD